MSGCGRVGLRQRRIGAGLVGTAAKVSAIGVAVVMLVGLVGCATQEPGARNTLGDVTTSIRGTPDELVAATERALRRLDMQVIASNATEVDGRVSARSPRGRAVDVRVQEGADNFCRVAVRVGPFGDQDVSIGIIHRIRRELQRDPSEYEGFEYEFEVEEMS